MADHSEMMRRQRALADFGDFVLDHEDLDEILNEGCRLVAEALGVDLAKVLEIDRETNTGLVRAGVGWRPGVVGHERVDLSERSSEAYAIERTEPVITNDIASEERFEFPLFLREHGVVALVNVPILLPGRRPWGVLQVDAREPREFDDQSIEFLKTYSMVLGPVIDRFFVAAEREQARSGLAAREERLGRLLDGMGEAFGIIGPDFTILEQNREALRLSGRRRDEVIGRSYWEVHRGSEGSAVGQCLKTAMAQRVPVVLEHEDASDPARALWLDMRAYPTAGGALAVFWRDVTERKRAEETLRASEERQAFLLAVGDAMRAQPGAREKIEVAARHLGERLSATRVLFAEFDHAMGVADVFAGWSADGTRPFPTVMRLEDHDGPVLDDLCAGRTVRINDVNLLADQPALAAIASVGVGALLSVPLLVHGTLLVNLSIHQQEARRWTDAEVALVQDVAERLWAEVVRARAQAALLASEERYRELFERIDEGFCIIEVVFDGDAPVDYRFLEVNPAFERQTGIVDGKGRLMRDIAPEHEQHWFDVYGEIALTGAARRLEAPAKALGDRWYDLNAFRVGEPEQRRVAILFNDITQRRSDAAALRQSEERFRLIVESVHSYAIFTTDRDGIITSWPAGAAAVYGWSAAEMLGESMDRTFLPEDIAKGAPEEERRIAACEGCAPNVRWHVRKDGERIFINGSTQPLLSADGEIRELIKVGEDITEDRRTQQTLAESEERLRNAAEVGGLGLWDWNVTTGEVHWSDEHYRMEGYAVGEVKPSYEAWASRIHPDDRQSAEGALQRAMEHREVFAHEFRVVHPNGSVHWLSGRGRFFYNNEASRFA
ncbi:PAS domain S-box protein [Sphingomonas desiccabilis]|uniref:histidine kinase n=1 Tax=Sphingomonas desiccabilis TaxID=429134 RepID=A0A4V1QPT6_9SPHN|nr:PAS domain S-box protein [Sphingomonas desiccabilis]MBB3910259.1 PAS domain S-box-containing protein [Sphingomonas desiccabilis]RXZ34927.1 PAS domain S-box protein [Sphingomonas desiccabilis]